jgi:hypothetical protein
MSFGAASTLLGSTGSISPEHAAEGPWVLASNCSNNTLGHCWRRRCKRFCSKSLEWGVSFELSSVAHMGDEGLFGTRLAVADHLTPLKDSKRFDRIVPTCLNELQRKLDSKLSKLGRNGQRKHERNRVHVHTCSCSCSCSSLILTVHAQQRDQTRAWGTRQAAGRQAGRQTAGTICSRGKNALQLYRCLIAYSVTPSAYPVKT